MPARSIWKLHPYPAGGTRVTRVVKDFKQPLGEVLEKKSSQDLVQWLGSPHL